jgi:hypothetical protein
LVLINRSSRISNFYAYVSKGFCSVAPVAAGSDTRAESTCVRMVIVTVSAVSSEK